MPLSLLREESTNIIYWISLSNKSNGRVVISKNYSYFNLRDSKTFVLHRENSGAIYCRKMYVENFIVNVKSSR